MRRNDALLKYKSLAHKIFIDNLNSLNIYNKLNFNFPGIAGITKKIDHNTQWKSNNDLPVTDRLHILGGVRYNYDEKKIDYVRQTYGGLETTDPDLIALKKLVYTDQAFNTTTDNNNVSYLATLNYKVSNKLNAYATYSTAYKSVGLNLGGLPTSNGVVLLNLATIKPEYVQHFEAGIKTSPFAGTTFNVTLYNTNIKDYQTQVQTAEVGVNRGYLANAEKVRIRGIEIDMSSRLNSHFSLTGGLAYTEGKYVTFTNAPVPLEETGGANAFKDISGGALPGLSKWTTSLNGEFTTPSVFLSKAGKFFMALDHYYRSDFSSSASPSKYLNVDAYMLFNGRIGFRANSGVTAFFWSRNMLDKNYFEQLLPAAGNAGQYAAVLGDPRTYGVTLRYSF